MRLDPGTYRALRATAIYLRHQNSADPIRSQPQTREEYRLGPGDTFDVPETVNGFYYSAEEADLVRTD